VRRCLTVAVLGALVTAAGAPRAAADDGAGAWISGAGDVVAEAVSNVRTAGSASSAGGGSGGGGSGLSCSYRPTSEVGDWLYMVCTTPDGDTTGDVVRAGDGADPSAAPQVDPRALAEQAQSRLAVPDPAIAMNPPPGAGSVVRVPTWLWLDGEYWRARGATASAGTASSTVTAIPVRVVWDMGDGGQVVCQGPGVPWAQGASEESTDCSHTYERSSAGQPGDAYTVTATVVWDVGWTSSVPGAGGDLGAVERSTSVELPVAQVQALRQ